MSKLITGYLISVHFSWLLLLQLLIVSAVAKAAPTIKANDVFALLEFEQNQIIDLERGKIVAFEIKERTQKDLAKGLAIYVPSSPAKLVAFFKQGDFATLDPDVTALGEITPQSGLDAFKGFVFLRGQHNEASDLLTAVAGDQFNLSAEEIGSFASLRKILVDANRVALVTGVSQHYQQILWQRWDAYRKQGLAGIAPYVRDGADAKPAEELRLAAANSRLLTLLSPGLQEAWLNYPVQQPYGAEERFFWLNRQVNDRPTAILSHRVLQASDVASLIITRQFFVGHSYNSSQLIVACLPYRDGTVVFYTHRTFTDQITGMGNHLKRSIGREQMKKQMIKDLRRLRSAVKAF